MISIDTMGMCMSHVGDGLGIQISTHLDFTQPELMLKNLQQFARLRDYALSFSHDLMRDRWKNNFFPFGMKII